MKDQFENFSLKKIHVGIIGGGGFTGRELIKLLLSHRVVSLDFVTSDKYANQKVSNIYPELGLIPSHLVFKNHPQDISDFGSLDVVFISAPEQVALQWTELLLKNNIRVIDIGGSFRLDEVDIFEEYYEMSHSSSHLLSEAVYGLSEVFRLKIASSQLVANPGCHATASLLPLWFLKDDLKDQVDLIIIDAKAGVSGAGARKEEDSLAFSHIYENCYSYKINKHQHTPEIQTQLRKWLGAKTYIRFIPHLLPIFRGILSTIYIPLSNKIDFKRMKENVKNKLSREACIRFYDTPNLVQIKNVQYTNFLDFSMCYDLNSNVLSIISVIDNLGKGAAGQAVKNMDIMFGLDRELL